LKPIFDRRFEDDPGADASVRKVLQTLAPRVSGRVLVYAGITSGTLEATPYTVELPLMILPAFKSVTVQKVVLTRKTDATIVGDLLGNAVNRYADNVSGVLSRAPMMALKVPSTFAGSFNPSQVIRIDNQTVKADLIGQPNCTRIRSRPMIRRSFLSRPRSHSRTVSRPAAVR
jgi:hypothetical protein